MRCGYLFWGHLGDKLCDTARDTPDGNAWYSFSIIKELVERGHTVYGMTLDRDRKCVDAYGEDKVFSSFRKDSRKTAYHCIKWINWDFNTYECYDFPDLDVLLLEWRFLIPERNGPDDYGKPWFQPDFHMQNRVLEYYRGKNTKIIIFDLDYKFEDSFAYEMGLDKSRTVIFETAVYPKDGYYKRISVEIPFEMRGNIPLVLSKDDDRELCYVGSRYERDDIIEKYIVPYSEERRYKVLFYGNWNKYLDLLYLEKKWWFIQYHERIGHSSFRRVYSSSIACPLLGKKAYFKNGFMTARILECLYFGSIPIGFREHMGIDRYLPTELIVNDHCELLDCVRFLQGLTIREYIYLRKSLWERLQFMDCSNFVGKMEAVFNDTQCF